MRTKNLKKLLRMKGTLLERVISGIIIISGFSLGVYIGRLLQEIL